LATLIIGVRELEATGSGSDRYLYEIRSVDIYKNNATFSFIPSAETARDQLENTQQQQASSSIVASSLLYDGNCYVSSQSMMCNEGAGAAYNLYDMFFGKDEEESEDDEDDDDDDNDGHSSMLSNACLRRSRSLTRMKKARCYAGSTATSTSLDTRESTLAINGERRIHKEIQMQSRRTTIRGKYRQKQPYSSFVQKRSEPIAFRVSVFGQPWPAPKFAEEIQIIS